MPNDAKMDCETGSMIGIWGEDPLHQGNKGNKEECFAATNRTVGGYFTWLGDLRE
jgi:hypothetical protein